MGVSPLIKVEADFRHSLLTGFLVTGFALNFFFLVFNFEQATFRDISLNIVVAVLFGLLFVWLRMANAVSAVSFTFSLGLLLTLEVLYGIPDIANIGLLWSPVLPIIFFLLLGLRWGAFFSIWHGTVSTLVLFLSPQGLLGSFSPSEGMNLLFAYLGICLVSGLFEKIRYSSYQRVVANERLFRELVDGSLHPVVLFDSEAKVLRINPVGASFLGFDNPSDCRGHWFQELVPAFGELVTARVRTVLASGSTLQTEDDVVLPSGRKVRFLSVMQRHEPMEGQERIVRLEAYDMTALKGSRETQAELERRLAQGEKYRAIGQLAGGIAHDFNNQLATMLTSVQLLKTATEDSGKRGRYLANMENSIRKTSTLVGQLLSFARRGNYRKSQMDLNHLMREVRGLVIPGLESNIVFHLDLCEGLLPTIGDPDQIQAALTNLVFNGRNAISEGGVLIARSHREELNQERALMLDRDLEPGWFAVLQFRDTSSGLSLEACAQIFEPYSSSQGSRQGMDLSAVYGCFKSHRGTVTVHSVEGQYTEFTCYLPLASDESVSPESVAFPEERDPGRQEPGQLCILLVDDETPVREMTRELLIGLGYRVQDFSNGEAVLDALKANPDLGHLVILDMIMPGLGGLQTFQQLQALLPQLPVILVSGYSLEHEAHLMFEKGLAGFVQKPFVIEVLDKTILRVLAKKPRSEV